MALVRHCCLILPCWKYHKVAFLNMMISQKCAIRPSGYSIYRYQVRNSKISNILRARMLKRQIQLNTASSRKRKSNSRSSVHNLGTNQVFQIEGMDAQQSGAGFPGLFLECEEPNLGESLISFNQELIQEFIIKQVVGYLENTLQIFIKIVIEEKSMIQA